MPETIKAPPTGSSWDILTEVLKYYAEVETFLGIIKGAKGMTVGAVQHIPDIKFQTGSEKFTLSGDANGISLTRTA